jgi:hypothetical protein
VKVPDSLHAGRAIKDNLMKYICFGYLDTKKWATLSVTDGPYAETKEKLGALLILEATDLDEAIQLLSRHPGVKMGSWEIRPVEDMTQVIHESGRRRSATR